MTDQTAQELLELDYSKEVFTRKENIAMLRQLLADLKENKRLNDNLKATNAKIAQWSRMSQTPAPRIGGGKIFWTIVAVLLFVAGSIALYMLVPSVGLLAFLLLLPAVAIIVLFILSIVKKRKAWKAYIENAFANLILEQENAEKDKAEIEKHTREVLDPFRVKIVENDKFASAYANSIPVVEGMVTLLENLRADTIKEVINLYEETQHRSKLEAAFGNMQKSVSAAAINAEIAALTAEKSRSQGK